MSTSLKKMLSVWHKFSKFSSSKAWLLQFSVPFYITERFAKIEKTNGEWIGEASPWMR